MKLKAGRESFRFNNKEKLTAIIFLIVLISGNYRWGYIFQYVASVLFLVLLKFRIDRGIAKRAFVYYLIPHFVIYVHAIISALVYKETFYLSRALSNLLFGTNLVIMGYCIYKRHGLRSIKIIEVDIIVFFALRCIEALVNVEPIEFFAHIFVPGSTTLSHWLELSDVGLSLGFLTLYYLFWHGTSKIDYRHFILLCLIFYFCFKRIALGAFAISMAYIIVFNKLLDKKNRLMKIWELSGIFICLGIVYLMMDSSFTNWMWAHGINVMGRDNLYRFFRPYYNFYPSFFGRGSGFTAKLLLSGVQVVEGTINTAAAIHSDILRVYIEYGFIGSILWYGYYLLYLPSRFKKKDFMHGEVVFACTLYAFVIYITDNSTYYTLFQILYMIIPLVASDNANKLINEEYRLKIKSV